MTKKEFFAQNMNNLFPIAYISALGGVEIYHIEYGLVDYIYCADGAWIGKKTKRNHQHELRIFYNAKGEPYIRLYNQRYYLKDAIRTDFC